MSDDNTPADSSAPSKPKPKKQHEPCACKTGGRCIWHTLDPETREALVLLRGKLIRHSPKRRKQ